MVAQPRIGRGGRSNPRSVLAAVLVVGGLAVLLRDHLPPTSSAATDPCADTGDLVPEGCGGAGAPGGAPAAAGPILSAAEACRDTGYLCAALTDTDTVLVEHWKGFQGTLVVHVPPPSFEDAGTARRLQNAAAAGILQWNGQPFPIVVDRRGSRPAQFEVRWKQTLGGTRLGAANTQWSPAMGLRVVSLELSTRRPFSPSRALDPRQVRLIAAHEMGHALGLPHSDQSRDVMYPTNTATSLTARDYRTVEALYALENGTRIVR